MIKRTQSSGPMQPHIYSSDCIRTNVLLITQSSLKHFNCLRLMPLSLGWLSSLCQAVILIVAMSSSFAHLVFPYYKYLVSNSSPSFNVCVLGLRCAVQNLLNWNIHQNPKICSLYEYSKTCSAKTVTHLGVSNISRSRNNDKTFLYSQLFCAMSVYQAVGTHFRKSKSVWAYIRTGLVFNLCLIQSCACAF